MIGKRFVAHALTMCGYRPRVRMPLLGYFAVVTPCLFGALFAVAEAFDATPPRMDVAGPLRRPGSRVQVAVASSLPILKCAGSPTPDVALTSTEDQIMVRQNEPIRRSSQKLLTDQTKGRSDRCGRNAVERATSKAQRNSDEVIGGFGGLCTPSPPHP